MSEPQSNDPPLPLVTHLTELRDRILRALLAVLVVFICLFPFANDIYTLVSEPLRALLPHEPVPLYALLRERGFRYSGSHLPDGSYELLIERS